MRTKRRFRVVASGVDKLVVNAYGRLSPAVAEILDEAQSRAIAERDARKGRRREVLAETPYRVCGQPLLIAPHGGGKGQWRWLLRCPAVTLEVGQGHLHGICCRATLSSTFLWRYGSRRAWAYVALLLDTWEATDTDVGVEADVDMDASNDARAALSEDVEPLAPRFAAPPPVADGFVYQVSELHLCADVAGMRIDELHREEFVHRGVIARWHVEDAQVFEAIDLTEPGQHRPDVRINARYGEVETLTFSQSAPHSSAIYNKPREIRVKSRDKVWFADIWRRNGWDGEAPITRVEMRYERDVLHEFTWVGTDPVTGERKTFRCESVDETLESADRLWAYSTSGWLRHTIPNPNDVQRSRWPSSPWWEVVQSARFGTPQTAPAQRVKVHAYHEARILATVLGYLESWSAYRAGKAVSASLDLSTVARDLVRKADDHYALRGSDFHQEVLKKRKRIGFAK